MPPSARTSPTDPAALASPNKRPIRKPYTVDPPTSSADRYAKLSSNPDAGAIDFPRPKNQDSSLPKVNDDAMSDSMAGTSSSFQMSGTNPPPGVSSFQASSSEPSQSGFQTNRSGFQANNSGFRTGNLPRERAYSTTTPQIDNQANGPQGSRSLSSPEAAQTVKNPFVNNGGRLRPKQSVTQASASAPSNHSEIQTGHTQYSTTPHGEFTPRNDATGNSASGIQNPATNGSLSPVQPRAESAPPVSAFSTPKSSPSTTTSNDAPGTSTSVPRFLKQAQGTYAPGSIKAPQPISFDSGGFTPPGETTQPPTSSTTPAPTGEPNTPSSTPSFNMNRSSGFQVN